mmetsp:Transcript_50352/g.151637  ORF Transcript_50352/g.151637 Transcript_50352/m.151637 type:complete len:1033 (-) Transcript_50352:696-3794(-)
MRTIRTASGSSFGLGSDNLALGGRSPGSGVVLRGRKKQGEDGIGSLVLKDREPLPFDDAPAEEGPAGTVATSEKETSMEGDAGKKRADGVDGVVGEADQEKSAVQKTAVSPKSTRLNLPPVEIVNPQAAMAQAIKNANENLQQEPPEKKGKKRKSLSDTTADEGEGTMDNEHGSETAAPPAGDKDESAIAASSSLERNAGASRENPPSGKDGNNGKKPPVRRVSSRSCSEDERRHQAVAIVSNGVPDDVKSVSPSDNSVARLQKRDGSISGEQPSAPEGPVAMAGTLADPSATAAAASATVDTVEAPPRPSSGPPQMGSRLFTRMGLGVASKSSPKETATEAALRAVSDALDKTLPTLVGTIRTSPLTAKVRLGVPHLLSITAESYEIAASVNNVDLEALCRAIEERGLTLAAGGLDVVEGGLAVKLAPIDYERSNEAGTEMGAREPPSSSSAACCCCVVASVTLGYATKASSAATPKRLRTFQQSPMTARRHPLLLQHQHQPNVSVGLLSAVNEGTVGAQEHLLMVRRADELVAENERLRRESEDRAAEIDLLRSRLALRDEALRLLGKESEEAHVVGAGGRGTGLRAAAAAMEGLRGLGSASAAPAGVVPPSQPAPALHHHAHMGQHPTPLPPTAPTTTQQRSSSLIHVAQAASAGLPGSDLPLPHIQRVTDLLNHSQLPPPRPFNVGEHLGHAQIHSSSPAASGPGTDITDCASALSTLGGAAALAAAAHQATPLPTGPAALLAAVTPTQSATIALGASGDVSDKGSPSTPGFSASDRTITGMISATADPPLPPLEQPSGQTPGYSYRKLKPGKTGKNNDRQFVRHNYTDYSNEAAPPDEEVLNNFDNSAVGMKRGGNKGQAPSFPFKLHYLLDDVARLGQDEIITWLPHGRCFRVLKQKEFVEHVMPRYFQLSKYSSFLRQLNLYGFHRFSAGPDKGAYYHELFLRGKPFLAKRMVRIRVNGNGIRSAGNPDSEPDFYAMPPVPHMSNEPQQQQGHLGIVSAHGTSGDAQYVPREYVSAGYSGQFASA